MRPFATLWRRLDEAHGDSTRADEALAEPLAAYLRDTPPDDAAWGVWLLAGGSQGRTLPAQELRLCVLEASGLPSWLVEECRETVGDLAETFAWLLDEPRSPREWSLHGLVEERLRPLAGLDAAARRTAVMATWRELPGEQRVLFNRLLAGALRPRPARARLARGLAAAGGAPAGVLEHRLASPWQPTPTGLQWLLAPPRDGEVSLRTPAPGTAAAATEAVAPIAAAASIDAVLLYAQRSDGGRGALSSDLTLAVWHEGALLPVARVAIALDEGERVELDRWVRRRAVERFGPVRQVPPELVFEVAFAAVRASERHKAGVTLASPRVVRWRRGASVEEAATLTALRALIGSEHPGGGSSR